MAELRKVDFACPSTPFPREFDGHVALGIIGDTEPERSYWFLFQVEKGSIGDVLAGMSEGPEIPKEVSSVAPAAVAVGPHTLWSLLPEDRERFFALVAAGHLRVHGDFREFGRLTPSLVRLAGEPGVWRQIQALRGAVGSA